MILVDTSVWVEHLRRGLPGLADVLDQGLVLVHPFVVGELACGNLANRREILDLLAALPVAVSATDDEVMHLLEERRLTGRGIGWVDAHLLASALLSDAALWTRDRRLAETAMHLGIEFRPE
ncbi:MAG: type II toxin-antitoxin system VapC family toxin [Thermoanaerobaculia bacterium]